MKKLVAITVFFFLCLVSLTAQERVNIYTGYSPEKWGRAADRSLITRIWIRDFQGTPPVQGLPEGYLTAVLADGRMFSQIMEAMSPGDTLADENTSFSWISRNGTVAFRLVHKPWDLDIIFSLEQAPAEILQDIRDFYRLDPYNRDLVLQEYREHRVIRIYQANDILEKDGRLSYGEALAAATLLGKTFQPFYGFHDGAGFLNSLGYLIYAPPESREPAVRTVVPFSDPVPTGRDFSRTEWEEFLHRLDVMEGSYPENLFILTKNTCRLVPEEGDYISPPDFLARKWGSHRDFALFYYRILRDKGYEVKLLRIRPGSGGADEHLVVFRLRSPEAPGAWGFLSADYWVAERHENWTRIPALRFQRSVKYQELDGTLILSSSRWIYPAGEVWEDSFW